MRIWTEVSTGYRNFLWSWSFSAILCFIHQVYERYSRLESLLSVTNRQILVIYIYMLVSSMKHLHPCLYPALRWIFGDPITRWLLEVHTWHLAFSTCTWCYHLRSHLTFLPYMQMNTYIAGTKGRNVFLHKKKTDLYHMRRISMKA